MECFILLQGLSDPVKRQIHYDLISKEDLSFLEAEMKNSIKNYEMTTLCDIPLLQYLLLVGLKGVANKIHVYVNDGLSLLVDVKGNKYISTR